MTPRTSTVIALGGGLASAKVGFVITAIFLPLLFPERLSGEPSLGESMAGPMLFLSLVVPAVAGFWICKRLTRRFVDNETIVAKRTLVR